MPQIRYVNVTTKPNGDLEIAVTDEGKTFVHEAIANGVNIDSDDFEHDLLEYQLCNGWTYIQPEEIGALTSGSIITDDWSRDDHGKLIEVGKVYWHERYALESVPTACLKYGSCTLLGRE